MSVACGQISPESKTAADAVATLIRVLGSSYQSARAAAAESLGKFGQTGAPAVPKLRALAGDPSETAAVRNASRKAVDAIEGR